MQDIARRCNQTLSTCRWARPVSSAWHDNLPPIGLLMLCAWCGAVPTDLQWSAQYAAGGTAAPMASWNCSMPSAVCTCSWMPWGSRRSWPQWCCRLSVWCVVALMPLASLGNDGTTRRGPDRCFKDRGNVHRAFLNAPVWMCDGQRDHRTSKPQRSALVTQ